MALSSQLEFSVEILMGLCLFYKVLATSYIPSYLNQATIRNVGQNRHRHLRKRAEGPPV